MAFAVIACSRCKHPWAVELRHATATCPRCQSGVDLARRRRFWEGESGREAQAAAASVAARMQGGDVGAEAVQARLGPEPARHDDPLDAAAAKARGVTSKSGRAEEVLHWLTRLQEGASHDDAVEALVRAGLTRERAEKEIVRMLAGDVIFEPRAGRYRSLGA